MAEQLALLDSFALSEGPDVEYKSAQGGLPASIWETYSAFANTAGGTIWLGVVERDGVVEIKGCQEPDKLIRDIWNTVNNRGKVSTCLLNQADVEAVRLRGAPKPLIRITVPRADRRDRPVYIDQDPFRGAFRRNHEGDYRCSEAEVRSMFADQSEEPADSRILEGFSVADLHQDSIRQFRQLCSTRQHVWLSEDDPGLLEKLGAWRRDRRSGIEGITVAGLLMFGSDAVTTDPAAVPNFQLDYRERFSEDPAIRWTDRVTPDGTWVGNLFQFYQRVMLKLSTGPGVRRPFQTNPAGLRTAVTPVTEALQEALVNALIHADYSGQGGIVIDRWIDRLEFSNPGTLLVSREQLWRGGVSECRNKALQRMFQMLGAGDKAGSGIDKIRAGWREERWQSPQLREDHRPDRIVLVLPMVSLLPEEELARLRQRFGPSFDELGPDETQTLVTAQIEGQINNQGLQQMLDLHRVDITVMLRGLVQSGFLRSDGTGRGTWYRIAQETNAEAAIAPRVGQGSPLSTPGTPLSTPGTPLSTPGTPIGIPDTPLGAVIADVGRRTVSAQSDAAAPSADVQRLLEQIAMPICATKRVRKEVMESTIVALCRERDLSVDELAALLGRKPKRLQAVLPHLLMRGLLTMRYPGRPNHPRQAYRAMDLRNGSDRDEADV